MTWQYNAIFYNTVEWKNTNTFTEFVFYDWNVVVTFGWFLDELFFFRFLCVYVCVFCVLKVACYINCDSRLTYSVFSASFSLYISVIFCVC